MSIVRYNPFREMITFEKEFSKLFNEFDNMFGFRKNESLNEDLENAVWAPLTDIIESKDDYKIKVDLPGMSKEDVKVSFENGTLAISGERKQEKETNENKFHRVERTYGKFYRSFSLPKEIDHDKIDAEFKDGQLMISVPKKEEAKPKLLEIKVK